MQIATVEQMRRLERAAIGEYGISAIDLMERAAEAVTEVTLALLGRRAKGSKAAVFCGTGNNGGDGLAVGRLLHLAGVSVRIFLIGDYEKLGEDGREMAARLSEFGLALEQFSKDSAIMGNYLRACDVVVDALFGIGLNRPITSPLFARIIERINEAKAAVVSVDLPSGMEADTGRVLTTAVHADKTVTFTLPKIGHFAGQGRLYCGELLVREVGIPRALLAREKFPIGVTDSAFLRANLPKRKADGHKGDFGSVAILGGSVGYTGAPVLAAQAAMRSGCGLVTLFVPTEIYQITAMKCDEVMVQPVAGMGELYSKKTLQLLLEKLSKYDAVLLGPGLGRAKGTAQLARELTERLDCPLILDADGINALAGHIDSLEKRRGRVTILTPHDGEFARLGGDCANEDRVAASRDFALSCGCHLLRKGHCSITAAPNGELRLNPTGSSALAKGGSGDVLGGILLALLGQGAQPLAAAAMAAFLHGRAGELCAANLTPYSVLARDVIGRLPAAFRENC